MERAEWMVGRGLWRYWLVVVGWNDSELDVVGDRSCCSSNHTFLEAGGVGNI